MRSLVGSISVVANVWIRLEEETETVVLSKLNDAPTRVVRTGGQSPRPRGRADAVQFGRLGSFGCSNVVRDRSAMEFAGVRLGNGGYRDAGAIQFAALARGGCGRRRGH